MKKKIVVLCLLLLCSLFNADAESSINNHIGFNCSDYKIDWAESKTTALFLNIQINYKRHLNDYLSIGSYFGYGPIQRWYLETWSDSVTKGINMSRTVIVNYGINIDVYLVPLLLKKNIPRLDFYLCGRSGAVLLMVTGSDEKVPNAGHFINVGLSAGISLYVTKKMGLNIEIGHDYYEYHKGFSARYGLTYRF